MLDYVCCFFVLYFLFDVASESLETHRKSWFLSFLAAARLSYESLYAIPAINFHDAATQAFSSNARADTACDIFLAFCFCDLVCAAVAYPKDFRVFEGLIHHVLYSVLILVLKQQEWTCLFWLCTFCEIPTLIMAAGKLWGIKSYLFTVVQAVVFCTFRVFLYGAFALSFFLTLSYEHYWWTLPTFSLIITAHLNWAILLCKKVCV